MKTRTILVILALAIGLATNPTTTLPLGWYEANIDKATTMGCTDYDRATDTWTLTSTVSANDAYGYYYVFKHLKGDGEIVARIISADTWVGLMIREGLSWSSRSVRFMYSSDPISGILAFSNYYDPGTEGGYDSVGFMSRNPEYRWMRMKRTGDDFSFYVSTNGSDWEEMNTERDWDATIDNLSMGPDVYIGIWVRNSRDRVNTVQFDNVEVISNSITGSECIIETRTSDPSNPVTGQIWLRTDL